MQECKCIDSKAGEAREYQRTKMQKDIVIQRLKDEGCRITKQRLRLLDIILEEDCSSCKEIYYKACKMGYGIGTATVYRMINTLESIGAISRRNMYKIACNEKCDMEACTIEFDDSTVCHLSASKLNTVITFKQKKDLVDDLYYPLCHYYYDNGWDFDFVIIVSEY